MWKPNSEFTMAVMKLTSGPDAIYPMFMGTLMGDSMKMIETLKSVC